MGEIHDGMAWRIGRRSRLERFRIQDREGRVTRMSPLKAFQRKLLAVLDWCHREAVPARVLVLKNRKVGVTTFMCAWMLDEIEATGKQALIISHDVPTSEYVLDIVKRGIGGIDEDSRPVFDRNDRTMLKWKNRPGSIEVFTAKSGAAPRSRSPQIVHFTESAHSPEEIGTALGGGIPARPGTLFIHETTANGEDPLFHDLWKEAAPYCDCFFTENPDGSFRFDLHSKPGWNNWIPLFSGILDDEDCLMPFKSEDEKRSFLATLEADWDEPEFLKQHRPPPELMNWRRYMIITQFKKELALFRQENPATADEAFQLPGSVRFHAGRMAQWVPEKPIRGHLVYESQFSKKVIVARDDGGLWRIYRQPNPDKMYVVGMDTAEGVYREGRKKPDLSAIAVLDPEAMEYAAWWGGYVPEENCVEPLLMAAKFYNLAYLVCEVNSTGKVPVSYIIKRNLYPRERIYHRLDWDELNQKSRVPGFKTTIATRHLLIGSMAAAIQDHVRIYDDEPLPGETQGGAISQYRHFVWKTTNRVEAAPGWNDDYVFAGSLCIEGKNSPRFAALKPIPQGTELAHVKTKRGRIRRRRRGY